MDFSLNDEQVLLRDSIDKFIRKDYSFELRRQLVESETGYSEGNWQQFSELGWLGIPFAEAWGGFGGGPLETTIVMEAFGRGLVAEPWLSTIILSGKLIENLGTEEQKHELLAGIIGGCMQVSLACYEPQARNHLSNLLTRAERAGDEYILNGKKSVVLNAGSADKLLVAARTGGEQMDKTGISIFLVDADTEGLHRTDYRTVDGFRASELTLVNVRVSAAALLGEQGTALAALEHVIDGATLAVCAEATGAMEVLYKATVEYARTRKQFGVPIGKFQALQHRMVNMFIAHEQSRSLLQMAVSRCMEGGDGARKAVSAAKIQIGKAGRHIGQEAVQLHGGMGMTDELNVGYYFKRLTCIDALFGNVDYHLERYSSL